MDKINIKLVNLLIILLIILTIYQTRTIWINILNIIKPLLISLIISYISNIYLRILNKRLNKALSIIVFLTTITIIIYILFFRLFPPIIKELTESINKITYFLKDISIKYNINIINLLYKLKQFDELIPKINIIGNILKYISITFIVLSISIYMFIDWNKIKNKIKEETIKNKKLYEYIKIIDKSLEKYTKSFLLLSLINIVEYILIFLIIRHPNYLLLGTLSGILSIIPIIGGITTNIVALTLAYLTNYKLFIRTIIGILVLTILDSYIISPLVYKKTNKIHPILSIITIYIGSKLFGILGTILALPTLIIIITTYKYIKKEAIY